MIPTLFYYIAPAHKFSLFPKISKRRPQIPRAAKLLLCAIKRPQDFKKFNSLRFLQIFFRNLYLTRKNLASERTNAARHLCAAPSRLVFRCSCSRRSVIRSSHMRRVVRSSQGPCVKSQLVLVLCGCAHAVCACGAIQKQCVDVGIRCKNWDLDVRRLNPIKKRGHIL